MGQVCLTPISPKGACHPRSSLLSVCRFNAFGVRFSECSMAGVRGKGPSLLHCTRGKRGRGGRGGAPDAGGAGGLCISRGPEHRQQRLGKYRCALLCASS